MFVAMSRIFYPKLFVTKGSHPSVNIIVTLSMFPFLTANITGVSKAFVSMFLSSSMPGVKKIARAS